MHIKIGARPRNFSTMIHGSIRALKDIGLRMAWSSERDIVIASGIVNVH